MNYSWQAVDPRVGAITLSGVFRAGFIEGTFDDALVVTAQRPVGLGTGLVQVGVGVTVVELVTELRPTSIRIFPETAEVEPNETLQLLPLALDANGVTVPDVKFKWEMLEPLAGSISQDGRLVTSANLGIFPSAIRVSLATETEGEEISTNVDLRIVDPGEAGGTISTTILPLVISLRPKEESRFSTLVLDRRGNQIVPSESRWEVLDPRAGVITESGSFVAGEEPGVYDGVVRVSMVLPGLDEVPVATATVIIVGIREVVGLETPGPGPGSQPGGEQVPRIAIYPGEVVLSPGESARVSIIGLGGDVTGLSENRPNWSVDPPEVGAITKFAMVTAHNRPGTYPRGIRAQVIFDTASGPISREVAATLVIRDVLGSVEIVPGIVALSRGEKVQFRAVAYDKNNILVPNVLFRWSVTHDPAGTVDANGLFTAEGLPGEYPGVIEVKAVERRRPPAQ